MICINNNKSLLRFQEQFQKAEQLFIGEKFELAAEAYLLLTNEAVTAPLAYYRLAEISNIAKDPMTAKNLYYKALSIKPDLFRNILPQNHPNHGYVFTRKKDELVIEKCPLCGVDGKPYWCYATIPMPSAHVCDYNPVRVWMRCEDCNHLFAEEYPAQQPEVSGVGTALVTNPQTFSYYSKILGKLAGFTEGNNLLEIGVGGCECALAATEMGFNVFGIDIFEPNIMQAKKYGINAEKLDFMLFDTDKKSDIIIMGDVIEHVPDPVKAVEKLTGLLEDNGVLWISTPNFESAFSVYAGHNDAMRKEASHRNYFSRYSLFTLLDKFDFLPVDYQISSHYNGSMEIIAIKKGYALNFSSSQR